MPINVISSHEDWSAPSLKSLRGTYITCEFTATYDRCYKTRVASSAERCGKPCEGVIVRQKRCLLPNNAAAEMLQMQDQYCKYHVHWDFPPLLCSQSFRSTQTCSPVVLKKGSNVLRCLHSVTDCTEHTELQSSPQSQSHPCTEGHGVLRSALAAGLWGGEGHFYLAGAGPALRQPSAAALEHGGESSTFYQRGQVLFRR